MKSMTELVQEWDERSYEMTEEELLAWGEAASKAMQVQLRFDNRKLDPKPWVSGAMRVTVRVGGHDWAWNPRDDYEKDASFYPKEYFAR